MMGSASHRLTPLSGRLNIMEPPIEEENRIGDTKNEQHVFRSMFGEGKSEQACTFKNRGY